MLAQFNMSTIGVPLTINRESMDQMLLNIHLSISTLAHLIQGRLESNELIRSSNDLAHAYDQLIASIQQVGIIWGLDYSDALDPLKIAPQLLSVATILDIYKETESLRAALLMDDYFGALNTYRMLLVLIHTLKESLNVQ